MTENNKGNQTARRILCLNENSIEHLCEVGYVPIGIPTTVNLFIQRDDENSSQRQICADLTTNVRYSIKRLDEAVEMARPNESALGYVFGLPIVSNKCNSTFLLTFPIQFYTL